MPEHSFTVPSAADIYKIAYMTTKGWEYDEWGKTWQKAGFARAETPRDQGLRLQRGEAVDLSLFYDIEEAYCAQLHSEKRTP
jgi:hypothetical protein